MADETGWLWAIIDIVGVLILAAAMFYAARRYANRNRAKDAIAEEATRRNYAEEDQAATQRGEA